MFRAGWSGHASSPGTSLRRGKGEAEVSPAGRALRRAQHRRGWRDKGAPSRALVSAPGFKAVTVQKLRQENTPRGPRRGREGARPRPSPPPSDVVRQRARLRAPISAPPPAGQGGTPIGTRTPRGRVGASLSTDWPCREPADQWRSPLSSATPPPQAWARDRPIPPMRAPGSPPPPRAQLPAAAAAACNLRRQDVAGG